jgi:hypothetical protein
MDEEPWDAPLREREQLEEDQTNPPDLLAGWAVPSFVRTGVPMMHTPTPEDKDGKPGGEPGGPGESGDADPDVGQEDGGGLGDGILEGLDALLDLLGGLFGGGEGGPIHRGPGWHIPDPPAPPPVDKAPPGLEKPDTPVSLPPGPVIVGDVGYYPVVQDPDWIEDDPDTVFTPEAIEWCSGGMYELTVNLPCQVVGVGSRYGLELPQIGFLICRKKYQQRAYPKMVNGVLTCIREITQVTLLGCGPCMPRDVV